VVIGKLYLKKRRPPGNLSKKTKVTVKMFNETVVIERSDGGHSEEDKENVLLPLSKMARPRAFPTSIMLDRRRPCSFVGVGGFSSSCSEMSAL
jgi:hypothetical protein